MWKQAIFVLCSVVALVIGLPAKAGTVVLVSDTWDYICKVEVMWGMNAPQEGPSQTFSGVKKEWKFEKPDRICYRRSGDPRNCDSHLTSWTCCSHLISGKDECSLS
jgi:hypothetical protein